MRFERLLANSKLHDDIEAGAKIIATNKNFVDAYKNRLFQEHLGVFRDVYGAGELMLLNARLLAVFLASYFSIESLISVG
jgi:hypothetical protein